MTQYLIPIFGNVNLYLGNTIASNYLEGVAYSISDAQAALTEVVNFTALGYIVVESSLANANTYLTTFTPLAARLAAGLTAVKRPLINTPASIAAFVAGPGSSVLNNEISATTGLVNAKATKANADAALAGAEAADLSVL